MIHSQQDSFFDNPDDNHENNVASDQLLKMVDSFDKKLNFDIKPGSFVDGTITKIGTTFIFVDIQTKNEAIMNKSEVEDENKNIVVKIGDSIKAYVVSNKSDEILLSKKPSSQTTDRHGLFDAFKTKIPVSGKVTGVSKDGLTVKIMGQRAFCPISQIDIKFTDDVNSYLAKTMDFVITKLTEGGRNIVVSRIPLLEQHYYEKIETLEKSIENHTVFHGVITKITDFGIFVDIDGVEGLVHISELSWERIDKPSDRFSEGQEVDCMVLKVVIQKPLKNSKISLSIKQVSDNPWKTVETQFSPGQSIKGKVVGLASFGAFVELVPGINGMVHISEMSWIKRVNHPSEIVSVGNYVDVTVLSIDSKKQSISLSLKNVTDDPWKDIEHNYPIGTETTGTIAKKSKYGYFVDLTDGVTGLLVFSNIASDKKNAFKEGDSLTITVVSIDKQNRRISLSHGVSSDANNTDALSEYQHSVKETPSSSTSEFGSALLHALNKKNNL